MITLSTDEVERLHHLQARLRSAYTILCSTVTEVEQFRHSIAHQQHQWYGRCSGSWLESDDDRAFSDMLAAWCQAFQPPTDFESELDRFCSLPESGAP